jgi:adenosine deaminase
VIPTQRSDLQSILAALPKIELHRHLEGSLRLATLAEIAREHKMDPLCRDAEALRPHVQVVEDSPDFAGYLAKFRLLRHFYVDRDVVMRLAYESVADAARDNVRYMELRFSPVALSRVRGFDLQQATDWVVLAVDRAQHDHDIRVHLIATIGREEDAGVARRVAEIAVSALSSGVVGLDLAGDETAWPAARFVEVFRWAKAHGLHITVHAGEAGPASNIREAVEHLGAERIGHGVHAGDDPAVLQMLSERRVALEMCPTSNLHTAAVPALGDHPLSRYQKAGVPVTINTDDPSISNTTLTDEYLAAIRDVGMTLPALRRAILHSAEAAFLPDAERRQMVEWFERTLPVFPAD